MSQEEENFGIGTETFDVLEQEFQDVLNDLAADQSLEKFRLEYEKLHRALKVSHENEKRLLAKCRELSADISGNVQRVQSALKMTQEDNNSIAYLKTQIEETYKKLDESREREEDFKQKLENLHSEMKALSQTLTSGKSAIGGNAPTIRDLKTQQDELIKEKEMLEMQIKTNEEDLRATQEKTEKAIKEKEDCIQRFNQIIKDKEILEQTTIKDDEGKKKMQDDLEAIKREYDESKKAIEDKTSKKEKLKEEKIELHRQIQKKEIHNVELQKLQKETDEELEQQQKKLNDLKIEIEELRMTIQELSMKYEYFLRENHILMQEKEKKQNIVKTLQNINDELRDKKEFEEKIREITIAGINQLENEINGEKRIAQDDRGNLEEMRRNRDILQKEIDRSDTNNKKQLEGKIQKEKLLKEKENEKSGLNKDMDRYKQNIKQLEKEKEKYGLQAAQANAKYFHSLEEIKLKDNLISEFQKKNIETESKLKQQQNLYEAVRSDRNLYSKNLTETQEEILEIKRRYKIVTHQISQLKEEIDSKENALSREHFEHKKKDKQIEEQAKSIKKYMEDIHEKEEKIKTYISEISKLHFMIKESEQQRQKLKEEYELVVAERDILGTQLIRRNTEAGLLYEKIKINQSTLKKGEVQYQERLGDIILLKSQIADLINDIKTFKAQANSIGNMKNEIHNLSKELIEEKLKVKALSEELENPMNVHRWRKLEATDSETYELMTKIQSLQKRLIQKTEQVSDKEKVVEQRDKQLKELRDIMRRQPGIEEEKMIPVYQQSLKQKTKQMRAMNGEMVMYQSHLSEYKLEIDRLTKELQTTKKKYYEQKKREQQKQEIFSEQQKAMQIQVNLPDKRIAGGGYNLAIYN